MDPDTTVKEAELVEALSKSVGEEFASAAVREAASELGLGPRTFSHEEALTLLEHLADTPGPFGITARFARSRLIAKWATDRLPA